MSFVQRITDPAYYNEFDPGAAAWLRELIRAGLIADGEVDERSILDVSADDVRGFTQCHWFAGIGGWSYALRLAGWPDDRPVWSGSPPCQPFSVAGKQKGRDDARHLAPKFINLVGSARPGVLFGEQVASSDVFGKAAKRARGNFVAPPQWAWLDDLSDRLEAACYAVGASDFPSAGVGAPHIRQRTFFGAVSHEWLADASCQPGERNPGTVLGAEARECGARQLHGHQPDGHQYGCADGGMAQPDRWERDRIADGDGSREPGRLDQDATGSVAAAGADGGLADTHGGDARAERQQRGREQRQQPQDGGTGRMADLAGGRWREECQDGRGGAVGDRAEGISAGSGAGSSDLRTSPLHGFWRDADWLFCRDGKWRPVESSVFGMADGLSAGMGHQRLECSGENKDGTESRSDTREVLQDMRETDGASTVQRTPRRQERLCAPNILRSGLHGARLRGHDQGDERQEQSSPVGQDEEARLRDLRSQSTSRSSSGRKSAEQRSAQPAEPLCFLSHEGTPPEACYPLATGVKHRAALLRGYGNAINPHAAAEFIRAFDESLRRPAVDRNDRVAAGGLTEMLS